VALEEEQNKENNERRRVQSRRKSNNMNKSTNKNDKKDNRDKKGKKIENTARARALARHCQRPAEGVVPSHHSRDTDRM